MKDMRARVRAAQAKGYTLEQIAEQAKPHGIDITAGTIRYALRTAGRGSGAGNGAGPSPGARARQGRQASQRCVSAMRRRPESGPQGRGKTVTRQPTPVQGTLGFAIRPDTDDL